MTLSLGRDNQIESIRSDWKLNQIQFCLALQSDLIIWCNACKCCGGYWFNTTLNYLHTLPGSLEITKFLSFFNICVVSACLYILSELPYWDLVRFYIRRQCAGSVKFAAWFVLETTQQNGLCCLHLWKWDVRATHLGSSRSEIEHPPGSWYPSP